MWGLIKMIHLATVYIILVTSASIGSGTDDMGSADNPMMSSDQQTFPPGAVTFPPSPTLTTVIDDSVVLFVGEPIVVGEDVRVTIDCSKVIDSVIAPNITIRWIKDGAHELTGNGSAPNVDISEDRRRLIITDTLLAVGGQIGNDGNYTCEVCDDPAGVNCRNRTTCNAVCGFPNIMAPATEPTVSPFLISMGCGQDVTVDSLATVVSIIINCEVFNGSEPFVQEVYKDGELIQNGSSLSLLITSPSDDNFGTYTFALSTGKCGTATAVSRIIYIVIETGGSESPSVDNGVITVNVGSTVYTINGLTVVVICNVTIGRPPITISWLRNGELLDLSSGKVSTISVTKVRPQGDVFTCRAENSIGFIQQNTTIQLASTKFCIAT